MIDGDAARAARLEALGSPRQLKHKGVVYDLPAELALEAAEALDAGKFHDAYAMLLGPERAEEFFASGVSLEDLRFYANGLLAEYGGGAVGEATDSPDSSKETSKRSRSRSSGSTGSTSAEASGDPRPLASAG